MAGDRQRPRTAASTELSRSKVSTALRGAVLNFLVRTRLIGSVLRVYERARARKYGDDVVESDGIPLPPAHMRVRIGGTPDAAWFLESGRRALSTIESATNAAAVELAEIDSALDFGCGVGRVLRWLKDRGPRLYGTDYDEEAVDWCRANLDFAEVCRNPLAPPLSFATNTFGLVYAFSVFTHLPVSLQALWLEELTRVTRSGGLLLMTTHGECYRGRLKGSERKTFDGGGVVVRRDQVAGTRVCSAFHPPAYVINTLAPYLDLVQHVPQGALGNPYQDLFVLRKPPG